MVMLVGLPFTLDLTRGRVSLRPLCFASSTRCSTADTACSAGGDCKLGRSFCRDSDRGLPKAGHQFKFNGPQSN